MIMQGQQGEGRCQLAKQGCMVVVGAGTRLEAVLQQGHMTHAITPAALSVYALTEMYMHACISINTAAHTRLQTLSPLLLPASS
jgi:hypothetical protein